MKHDSLYGTTCWVCGHPGIRTMRGDSGIKIRACDNCKQALGSEEDIRQHRNADVAALVREDYSYRPQYWSQASYEKLLRDYNGLPRGFADKLHCQQFADEFLERTKNRLSTERKAYDKEYYQKTGGAARKEWYKRHKENELKQLAISLEKKDD